MVQGTRSQPRHRVLREHRQPSPMLRRMWPALAQGGRLFHQAPALVSKRPYQLHGLTHGEVSCAEARELQSGMAPGDWYP